MEKIVEMVCSALVQEAVSRGVSFGLSLSSPEEKASQGHLLERLQMAASQLEFAVERAQELRIRHLPLISQRKQIKSAYVEAMELLDKHRQKQEVPEGQELQVAPRVKRKRWNFWSNKDMPVTPSASLSADAVRRFELHADFAHKFVRDVESGCSLHHNTFLNPIVRHLLEGKTLHYDHWEQGNLLRCCSIWPVYSDERGVEAMLRYWYGDRKMIEKYFFLALYLRLSESTDIVEVAIKGFQLLTCEFKVAAEFVMGELTMLSNLPDFAQSYGPPWVGMPEGYINETELCRPDPACCKGRRHGVCANNNISSELSGRFPEQVILWAFESYYVPAIEPRRSSCSSFDGVGRSKSRGGVKPPLLLRAAFVPHDVNGVEDCYAVKAIGDDKEYIDGSIQQMAEALKPDAVNCLFRQPEQTEYWIHWRSKHGRAYFKVKKATAPKTRKYNTRGNTRSSRR